MNSQNILSASTVPVIDRSAMFGAFALALCLGLSACSAADDTSTDSSADSIDTSEGPTRAPRQPGVDIYAGTAGLHDDALKAALYELVKNHLSISYDRARKVIFTNPGFVDDAGNVECVYTGRIVQANGTSAPGGFNTEHSWPQSLGAQSGPAKSDIHHLFPVDSRANSTRGNHPFDFVTCLEGTEPQPEQTEQAIEAASGPTCSFSSGGSALGKNKEGKTSFEVRQKMRGDIARAHFYFSIRYDKRIGPAEEEALRTWSDEDPVDDVERKRNDLIEQTQRNRSPFVDHPEFVAAISDF
jgi:deoxyribonuclease-1